MRFLKESREKIMFLAGRPGAQLLEADCGTLYSLWRRYFAALGGHSVAH